MSAFFKSENSEREKIKQKKKPLEKTIKIIPHSLQYLDLIKVSGTVREGFKNPSKAFVYAKR